MFFNAVALESDVGHIGRIEFRVRMPFCTLRRGKACLPDWSPRDARGAYHLTQTTFEI